MIRSIRQTAIRYWPEIVFGVGLIALLFWRLDWPGMVGDDAAFSVRSWRLVDFLFSPYQTTPWQWFNPLPWWVKLSFHDAPPLAFWIQHLFFNLFGASTFIARTPAVLAGIITAGLVYAVLRSNFGRRAAVIGLVVLLTLTPFFWLQRFAYFEPIMMPFIMAAIYSYQRAKYDNRWYWAVGIVFGLALLTKYTALFLVPALFVHLIMYRRKHFKTLRLWAAVAVALILQYPVILYNILMYRSRGHADVQISALLGLSNKDWPILTTGVSSNFATSLSIWAQNSLDLYSWMIVSLVVIMGVLLIRFRLWRETTEYWTLLTLLVVSWLIFILLTRQDARFIATGYIFVPFFTAPVVAIISRTRSHMSRIMIFVACALVVLSSLYNLQTNYMVHRWGETLITYSSFHQRGWSLREVERKIESELRDKEPSVLVLDDYYRSFDEQAAKQIFDFDKSDDTKSKYDGLIIYDQNINWFPEIWYFKRIFYFQRFLVISSRDLLALIKGDAENYLSIAAGKHFYYFQINDPDLLDKSQYQTPIDPKLLQILTNTKDVTTINPDGTAEFTIYSGLMPAS